MTGNRLSLNSPATCQHFGRSWRTFESAYRSSIRNTLPLTAQPSSTVNPSRRAAHGIGRHNFVPTVSELPHQGERVGHLVRSQQFFALAPRQGAGNLHRCSLPNENLWVLLQLLQ